MSLIGLAGPMKRRGGGFVLVTMAISATVLLAIVGLAIDTGYLQLVKTRMQTAADAAAVGGVQEIKQNGAGNVVSASKADAALNGFTDGVNSVTITVNHPPASGSYTSDQTGVEAIVSQNVGPFFMQLLGFTSVSVRARAVARQGSGTNCLYALDPSAASAFSATGGATVNIAGGVMVDSSSATALVASGGAHVTAASFTVVGNYSVGGGASVTPAPAAHASPTSDPLAYVTPPAAGGACLQTNYSIGNGKTTTLNPGVYCNGITLNGGATVTMNPGTYVLRGGGLTVSNGATLNGTGVTFYNTQGSGYTYGAISLLGGVAVQLTAPTTGSLAGILFFQDRSVAAGPQNTFSNGSASKFDGALYFPTTALSYTGGAAGLYTIIVAKTVSFSGGITLKNDYSSLPGGSPVKGNATLSE